MPLASAEVFDLYAQGFVAAAPMSTPRSGHAAVELADGRVLVTGGTTVDGTALASAEVYEPWTGVWYPIGNMATARTAHTATRLADDRILIAGGSGSENSGHTLEILDPNTWGFTVVGSALSASRKGHAAARLGTGDVVIAGGSDADGALASSDIFSVASGQVIPGSGDESQARRPQCDSAARRQRADRGRPQQHRRRRSGGSVQRFRVRGGRRMGTPRRGHLAVLLPQNNQVLIIGGLSDGNS